VAGGHRMERPGFYIEPTVFTDVDPSSELAQTGVLGPVLAVTKFSTDEEAIAIANSTRYGLSSYIQTKDVTRAHRIAAALEAGNVVDRRRAATAAQLQGLLQVTLRRSPRFCIVRPFDPSN
jgi:aldehyde dehydrogenase (NAD+)